MQEIAGSASISRESVLKSIAPQVPAYREAQREIDNLKGRLQDVSGQLAQAQAENRKLESETKSQQAELSRLKSANAALQSKIDDSASQISKLGDDLRDAKGSAQGYQRELANLQRSLNLKVDSGRDLAAQIADLGQALRKLQKENETLGSQISSLRANLDSQQAANARLLGNNEELKAGNSKLQATINTLTSKEDSLARQYLDLKREKEKLEDFSSSVAALRTRIEEEKTEGGNAYRQGECLFEKRPARIFELEHSGAPQSQRKQKRRGGVLGGIDRRPAHQPRGKAFAAHARRQAENAGGPGVQPQPLLK